MFAARESVQKGWLRRRETLEILRRCELLIRFDEEQQKILEGVVDDGSFFELLPTG